MSDKSRPCYHVVTVTFQECFKERASPRNEKLLSVAIRISFWYTSVLVTTFFLSSIVISRPELPQSHYFFLRSRVDTKLTKTRKIAEASFELYRYSSSIVEVITRINIIRVLQLTATVISYRTTCM